MAIAINILRAHNLDSEQVRQRVERIALSLNTQFKMRYEWEQSDLLFTGKGVSGRIRIGATDVRIEMRLGVLRRPFKRKIKAEINAYLDAHLD